MTNTHTQINAETTGTVQICTLEVLLEFNLYCLGLTKPSAAKLKTCYGKNHHVIERVMVSLTRKMNKIAMQMKDYQFPEKPASFHAASLIYFLLQNANDPKQATASSLLHLTSTISR